MIDAGTLRNDLDRGVSLPASWFTDPALTSRERDCIFRRAWQPSGAPSRWPEWGPFTGAIAEGPWRSAAREA